ncbi:MAG: AI-2E family transporter [Pseudomonadota bacterium]
MFDFISAWYKRYFTDPQAALLVVLLVLSSVVLAFMGKMLAPLLAALVIAYLLEGMVRLLHEYKFSRILSVNIVFILFVLFMLIILLGFLPIISTQVSQFFQEMPAMINNGQDLLLRLPGQYPQLISEEYISQVIYTLQQGVNDLGKNILSFSLASIPAIVTVLIYLVLVPLMIFFFLKDKVIIQQWLGRFLPKDRHLLDEVWLEMDAQIGNYVRGKFYEIIIVGAAAYALFIFLDLNYAPLLALLVGLSVLIPYIGAAVVTLPVALVGYFQWGLTGDFYWLMIGYFVLQFLDGNVLVPILFAEAVKLHPVAIIAAILVFGGLWGFWGVFFAIPLATLVKALINVWPTQEEIETAAVES